jgi:hypothetical protein
MSEQKWVRSSLAQLSERLTKAGHRVSAPTVGRLLRKLDFGLHGTTKQVEARAEQPERDTQFRYIEAQREQFRATQQPVISVDTKKKELIGNFKNVGRVWRPSAEAVNVHDFPGDALARAVPYGIYDLTHNRGTVYVGASGDTPRFAVEVVARWWAEAGQAAFPGSTNLLLLADAGGSNSAHSRVWKQQLQAQLCDGFGLTVTVCHYPTGCSKWNPIEHRLFGLISTNWAGQPLRSFGGMLGWIRGTKTATGLQVRAELQAGLYPIGEQVSKAEFATLNLERHTICPTWNYTLRPRSRPTSESHDDSRDRELIS